MPNINYERLNKLCKIFISLDDKHQEDLLREAAVIGVNEMAEENIIENRPKIFVGGKEYLNNSKVSDQEREKAVSDIAGIFKKLNFQPGSANLITAAFFYLHLKEHPEASNYTTVKVQIDNIELSPEENIERSFPGVNIETVKDFAEMIKNNPYGEEFVRAAKG